MKVIRFLIAFEIAMWRSLYRWIFRRPRTRTPEGVAFAYTRVVGPRGSFVARIHLIARNGRGVLRICAPSGSAIGKATINMAGSFTLITTVSKVLARTGGEAGLALFFGASTVVAAAARRIARRRRSASLHQELRTCRAFGPGTFASTAGTVRGARLRG